MASLRLKSKPKSKYNNGLPQFYSYKDKQISNNYSGNSFFRLLRQIYYRYKILVKAFFLSLGIYFVYNWIFDSSSNYYSSKTSKSHIDSSELWNYRKLQVKNAFLDSWNDYVKHGWGMDVYSPVKQSGKNIGSKPLGWIIVDSLDTMMLMGLTDQLEDAKSWVDKELDYNIDSDVNVFETTIRMLGGLLSAHYLSEDPEESVYLEKAVQLGNKLVTAFNTPSGIPVMELNLHKESGGRNAYPALGASTAEIATLQLEFKYLSNLTGEAYFWNAAEKVMTILNSNQYSSPSVYNDKYDGLAPIYVNQHTGKFSRDLIRLGSRGDSYYEYLLKQYLQTDEKTYLNMYRHAYAGIKKHLMRSSYPNKLVYLGELPNGIEGGVFDDKMDHLVCFIGGLFALGATEGLTEKEARLKPWWNTFNEDQLNMGKELAKTCYYMYHDTPGTGLSPEIVVFNSKKDINPDETRGMTWSTRGDFYIKPNDKHNLQRPETVETLYYLYKITGDLKYREWGWEIFQNFIKYSKVTDPDGKNVRYTSLRDCTIVPPVQADNLESFWLAETLKYLYLLFDDETGVSGGMLKNGKLDKWDLRNMIFNTEAHPLPKFDKTQFGDLSGSVGQLKTVDDSSIDQEIHDFVNSKNIHKNEQEVKDDKIDKTLKEEKVKAMKQMRKSDDVQIDPTAKNTEEEHKLESKLSNDQDINSNVVVSENLAVADKMKAAQIKPGAKQPVAKPLNEQAEDAIIEFDKKLNQEKKAESDPAIKNNIALADNVKVASEKQNAKLLDEQGIDFKPNSDDKVNQVNYDTQLNVEENVIVADKMKAQGRKPEAKQEVAKSLNEQVAEALAELEYEE
jgi:mannosyl-oligosaccharide alpha-1,2-mannosidase